METIAIHRHEQYAIVQLDRGKSNPINTSMILELSGAFRELEQDEAIQGIVLTGKGNFFSAGLDLPELYQYSAEEFEHFWMSFMSLIKQMLAFPKPLICSITGHSPAGGCVLAVTCDYRVMSEGNYRIGLNEIPVGIIVPGYLKEIYAIWVGQKNAFQFLMEGKLLLPEEAKAAGLVDEIVPLEEVEGAAVRKLKHYLQYNQNAWRNTKMNLRRGILAIANEVHADEIAAIQEHWWRPETRKMLEYFVEKLKKK
jgi:enoyl-CoA hydratase/carnithine racemase